MEFTGRLEAIKVFGVPIGEYFGWITPRNRQRRDLPVDNRSCLNNSSLADFRPWKENDICANPHKIPNHDLFHDVGVVIGNRRTVIIVVIPRENAQTLPRMKITPNGHTPRSIDEHSVKTGVVGDFGTPRHVNGTRAMQCRANTFRTTPNGKPIHSINNLLTPTIPSHTAW